ncbi:hypothetical protein [uncultured Methanobrevibacter sp.]|uniref:hypothetical protein n=1 Tax=uncultured Methanobrevibacter sp. TaxID=253161 RepID=UPI0025F60EE4|nr:hypothetical protein [uncultured Methanobrevibacter sp.]
MKLKKPYHSNDITHKYAAMAFRKKMHEYLDLPGTYHRRYPTEVVLRTMATGRMDELYSTKEGMLINLKEESDVVTEKTLAKLGKYKTFASFIYGMPLYTGVICLKNPKNFPKEYEISPTDIIRPKYYYFSQEKLWKNYDTIINKVEHNIELSEKEALHIAFVPKYISKKYSEYVTKSFSKLFKHAKIPDEKLKRDIAFILMTMILSNIDDETEQDQLLEAIDMDAYRDDMEEIVYSRYGDELERVKAENKKELAKKDKELAEKNKEITRLKTNFAKAIEEINARKDIPSKTKKLLISTVLKS